MSSVRASQPIWELLLLMEEEAAAFKLSLLAVAELFTVIIRCHHFHSKVRC